MLLPSSTYKSNSKYLLASYVGDSTSHHRAALLLLIGLQIKSQDRLHAYRQSIMTSTNASSSAARATASSSPSNITRSVSQILADSLQDSSTSSSSSGPSGPRGSSLPSAKKIALRARYNRRVSYDDVTEADVQQLVAESRRLSYNDALPSSRYHSSRLNSGRYSMTTPSSVAIVDDNKQKKRVSFSEDLSSNGAEEEEDEKEEEDDEGYAAFATAAAAGAKAAKSRQHLQQQTRRRLSYNDALEYSSRQTERSQITSIMKAAPRRRTMGNALDYDTDEDDDHDSEKCPRRRVSFSSDLVSSVKLIPHITKLQKREMFYRKREIKQFRIDSWLEQAMVISDEHYADQVSLPPTTKSNANICRKPFDSTSTVSPREKSSLLPLRGNSASRLPLEERSSIPALDDASGTSLPRRTFNSTRDIVHGADDKDQNESTDALKDALRDSMSQRLKGAASKVDRAQTTLQAPPPTIDETFKGGKTTTTCSPTHDGVPSLSGPFFTSSDVMSAAALAASNASSSASAEEKIGDWTESLRISARSRIDAAIARQSASRNRNGLTSSSTSSSPPPSIPTEVLVNRRGRRPRMKRRGSIEALAA